ncbi:S1C family serine protease [Thermodesulfobacteriota bacterium]
MSVFSRRLSLIVTIAFIFGTGLVLGIWVKERFFEKPVPPPRSTYKALEPAENIVMDVYQRVSPSVVNIVATRLSRNLFRQVIPETGQGTGFVIDSDGHILTNNHVVGRSVDVEVTFLGGKKVKAHVVGQDPESDLCVIRVEPFPEMKVAELGNSDGLNVGQRVIAIGNPFGFQHTVTTGFVSALHRDVTIGQRAVMGMIQTDAAINPGNSGGPLMNSRGEVIGVNTAIYTQSGGFIGIGLALPINRARKVANQIVRLGRVIYPWVGIEGGIGVTPAIAPSIGLPPVEGILIFDVYPNSPASKAGLRGGHSFARLRRRGMRDIPIVIGGDVILGVDDNATPNWDDFRNAILQHSVGDTVKLTILRQGSEIPVDVTLEADPRMRGLRN